MSEQWYAVQTRPRHERVVENRLQAKGLEVFLPISREVHRWSDRRKHVEVPLFSNYVFVRIRPTPEDRLRVFRVEGLFGFVGARGEGTPIPDEQIRAVQVMAQKNVAWSVHPFLQVGQRVRIRGGALEGLEGIFVSRNGEDRLVISIDTVQRSLSMSLAGYDLEVVGAPPTARGERFFSRPF